MGWRRRDGLKAAAVVAAVGGALWVVKGAMIIFVGRQPAYLFEAAPILFALSVASLWILARPGKFLAAGRTLAITGVLLSVTSLMASLVVPSTESSFTPWSLLPLGSMVTIVAALILLGATNRPLGDTTGERYPLVLGVTMAPLVFVGGVLFEAIHEHLFELPIVLLGLGWMVLGVWIWKGSHAASSPETES